MKSPLCLLLVLASHVACAQYIDQNVINAPIPPTPQAASLLKHADIPLSYYTGSAEISIPIYELKGKDLNLPISLTFSPTGLKVDEIASWCGFGWSLSASGVVSRTIVDIPDEWGHGYFSPSVRKYFKADGSVLKDSCTSNLPTDPGERINYLLNAHDFYALTNRGIGLGSSGENSIDTEPDVFNFSTPTGVSGKFVMDLDQNVRMIPKKPVRVNMIGNGLDDKTFNILDESGILYEYSSVVERVNTTTLCSNLSGTDRYGTEPIGSWYISSMKSEKSGEQIFFGYEEENTSYVTTSYSQSFIISTGGGSDHSTELDATCTSTTYVSGVRPSSIYLNDIQVQFIADTAARLDLTGGHRLKFIRIMAEGQMVKEFELYHSYDSYLRLDSIVERGINGARLPAYKFLYNEIDFAHGDFSQDHWGYYNAAENYTLLPKYQEPFMAINYYGADRETNPEAMEQGALHTVIYPTGGSTTYDYEPNTVPRYWVDVYTRSVHANSSSPSTGSSYMDEVDFTLTETTYVEIVNSQSWMGPGGEIHANCGAEIIGVGNPYYQPILDNADRVFFSIPAGDYKLRAHVPTLSSPVTDVACSIRWEDPTDSLYNKPVGGLRLKTVKKFDGITEDPVLTRHLEYNDSTGLSTGKLFTENYYWYDLSFNNGYACGSQGALCCDEHQYISYRVLKSSNLIQPTWIQGSTTGYSQVTEYVDQEVAGKTVYTYFNQSTSLNLHTYPQVQSAAHAYKQSLLLKKEEYNSANVKVRESINYPKFGTPEESHKVYGFQLARTENSGCPECIFTFSDYYHLSQPMATDSVVEISYENSVQLKQLTYNEYSIDTIYNAGDTFYQLRTTTVKDSDNRTWITENKYPHDFREDNSEMAKLYALNTFVPVMQILKDESNNVYDSRIIQYDDYKPIKYFDLEITSPASYATISAITDFDAPGNGFVEKASFAYSADALRAVKKSNNLSQAFIWDEGDQNYLIAEVNNALPDEVYFNNFEYSGTTGTAHTGRRYLNSGSFNFTTKGFTPSVTTHLRMSYWYWSGSAWLFSGTLPFSNTISQGTRLDDIRVFPETAQMTTYTHEPGVGMTSATDANNQVIYYQYDDMSRLRYILDDKKNILKKVDYHYTTGN